MAAVSRKLFDTGEAGSLDEGFDFNASYATFRKNLAEDWTNVANAFSTPRSRAYACSFMINCLVRQERVEEAQKLFAECKEKKAWDASIGICMLQSKGVAQKICDRFFYEAKACLPQESDSV